MNYRIITIWIMVVATVVLIAWDLVVGTNKTKDDTISEILLDSARHQPLVALALGVLIGHFFWPTSEGSWAVRQFLAKYPIILAMLGVLLGHYCWSQK